MKLSILFVAIFGVATATALPSTKVHSRHTRDLSSVWDQFTKHVDLEKALDIGMQYLIQDTEVQAALEYITSPTFKELVLAVDALEEYKQFLDYCQAQNLDVYKVVSLIHDLLGIDNPLSFSADSSSRQVTSRITGGIRGLLYDLLEAVDVEACRALYREQLATNEEFAAFVAVFSSDEARHVFAQVAAHPSYQDLRAKLEAKGIDVNLIINWLKNLVGL